MKNKYNSQNKRLFKIINICLALLLLNVSFLPAYCQSGISNIGFFNKNKKDKSNEDVNYSNATTIKEVLIEGNRLIPEEHILNIIDSKAGTTFDRDIVLGDLENLDKSGYFVRDSIQADPEQTNGGILLKIKIEENNPITRVQILGNKIIPTDELLIIVQPLIAKPESLIKISETLDQIEKKYRERGFLLARVSDISVDPDGTLTVQLSEGIVDNIIIKGNSKTKEKYIKRLMPNLVQGEPYNEVLLVQDLRALEGTGLFENIKRTVSPAQTDKNKYDLTVELSEKRSSSFGFGGGVNTLNGVFANFGYSNNNLFGEGKQAAFNTQFGTGLLANSLVGQRFLASRKTVQVEAKYSDPNFLNTKNAVTFYTHGYTFNSYLVDLAQEQNIGLGVSLSRPIGKGLFSGLDLSGEDVMMREFGSSATNFLTDQLVKVDNGKFLDNIIEKNAFKPGQKFGDHEEAIKRQAATGVAKQIREEQLQGGKYLNFNPSLVFDSRDNALSPRSGWNNRINLGQAIGIGNDSFTKFGVDLRRYVPIGQKTTLAFNLQGSSRLIGDIPMYNQFKAGGYYGVRGYRPFSDLGIGKRSLLGSAEIRTSVLDTIPGFQNTPLGQNLKLALFTDFGYVGGNNRINRLFNRLDTAISSGIGFRANIPMLGPIRVDYGLPFIKPLWNSRSVFGRFNFGFGERF